MREFVAREVSGWFGSSGRYEYAEVDRTTGSSVVNCLGRWNSADYDEIFSHGGIKMLGDSLEETEFDNSRSREATAQDLCAMGYVVDLSSGYPSELVYTENGAEDVGAFDSLFGTPAGKAHDERERKSSSWF